MKKRGPVLQPVNDEDVLKTLDQAMSGYGNGKRVAIELDVNYSHIRQIKAGRRRISRKVAEGLGFELRWVRVSEEKK